MTKFKTVGLYATPLEAHLAKVAPDEVGIPAIVENENYLSSDGPTWPAEGVRVTVRLEDVEKARNVLDGDDGRR